jgi:hypothetical protein
LPVLGKRGRGCLMKRPDRRGRERGEDYEKAQ